MMASVSELLVDSLNELITAELKSFHWYLRKGFDFSASELENTDIFDTVDKMVERFTPDDAVMMTQNIFRKMNKNEQAELLKNKFKEAASETVDGDLSEFINRLKNTLKQDYERILDGNSQTGHRKYLRDVYTDLFVVENETGGVVNEHEVRQIEINPRRTAAEDSPIKCSDLFKVQRDTGRQNRKVLTMGIAGVGKTVSVNKFILDWAEGKKNQEIDFIFPLPLRQLNLVQKDYSLMELIHKYFFSSAARPPSLPEEEGKVMFIFDGLDECRFPLTFEQSEKFTDVHEKTTVDVIVTNLIERNLLRSALIWITSRPAAASLIPRDYIDQVTEVRGFNDEQKEKYFTKNSSPEVAEKIMSHIKKSRSLYIMCHIPVFCWISLSVLQPLLARENQNTIPTTLTGMYIYFLLQMQQLTKKYDAAVQSFEDIVLKLGKLAFEQLQKGILIFYKEDLEECGLDVKEGLIFSGLCTRLFQIEKTVSERGVYSFVHLSVQEFLAALYVFLIYQHKKQNSFLTLEEKKKREIKGSLLELHETAVINALQSKNGHLDLLLRFLMGLSLESNQDNLKELLPTLKITSENMELTADYIKMKIVDEESAEKSINLFYCLSELKNDSLQTEIQRFLSKGGPSAQRLSSLQWSALLFMLMTSDETQEMFEMQKYGRSNEDLIKFLPVIKYTRRALLQSCNLTGQCCEMLSSALQSSNFLRELNLSNNDLQDSGVKMISDALRSPKCQLHILRLHLCNLTGQCCEMLSSALQSSNFLRELDLSNNDLQDSGVKMISDALRSPKCQLHILRLHLCNLTGQCCESLASCLQSLKSLRELNLSNNDLQDSGVKMISDALRSLNCQLHILRLAACNVSVGCCKSLALLLKSSNSPLRELDLSNNDLHDSGVKMISDALKSSSCQLHIMSLSGCLVTEEGCAALASALRSNPSHLRELDLSYNHPGETGVQLLSALLEDPHYKLNKLNVDHGGEFRMAAGLHKYARDLSLDPNTAHTELVLSEENRKTTHVTRSQVYPDHPDRFDHVPQVLCGDSLSGRCYWEAEWSGSCNFVAVTYKSISRKEWGAKSAFGFNEKSWSLECSLASLVARHNKNKTDLRAFPWPCKRAGVYVDWSAGTLSFYSISETHKLTHLHTFITTFTEPLCAGFRLDNSDSSVSLRQPTPI